MKNMKRTLAFLLTCVLLLTPFATIPAGAKEQLPEFLFGAAGYKFGAAIEDIEIKEYYEGSVWKNEGVYESWEAHIEYENGEVATGNIQANIQYVLSVRINGLSEKYHDSYQDIFRVIYGGKFFAPYGSEGRIFDVYLDEDCLTFKYKLEFFVDIWQLVFNIEGFELGADPRDVRVSFDGHEYVKSAKGGLQAPTKDLEEEAPIREGIQYSVQILLEVSDKIETVDDKIDFVLKGLQEDISGEMTSSVSSSNFFSTEVLLPVLGEPLEEIKEFDLRVEGYENGNTVSQVLLKSETENIAFDSVFTLSNNRGLTLEAGDLIELGKTYKLTGEFSIPKGYDILTENFLHSSFFPLSGVSLNGAELNAEGMRSTENYETFVINVTLPILYIDGDVDFDGVCTVADALSLLRIAASLAYRQDHTLVVGDFDSDGEISVSDALAVLRLAAKLN